MRLLGDESTAEGSVEFIKDLVQDVEIKTGEFRQVKMPKSIHAEICKAEESERKRIADVLHDGLAQYLSLVNLKLSNIVGQTDNPKIVKTIMESTELISLSIKEARELIHDIHLPILKELGLQAALKFKRNEWIKDSNSKLIIHCEIPEHVLSFDNKVLAFRIISELIANVYKHAAATRITIRIIDFMEHVLFKVTDNGNGFFNLKDLNFSPVGGYGLFRIKERLELANGKLYIESKPGGGSRISFLLPKDEWND